MRARSPARASPGRARRARCRPRRARRRRPPGRPRRSAARPRRTRPRRTSPTCARRRPGRRRAAVSGARGARREADRERPGRGAARRCARAPRSGARPRRGLPRRRRSGVEVRPQVGLAADGGDVARLRRTVRPRRRASGSARRSGRRRARRGSHRLGVGVAADAGARRQPPSRPSAATGRHGAARAARLCSVKRTCIRRCAPTARIRASKVAARSGAGSAVVHAGSRTLARRRRRAARRPARRRRTPAGRARGRRWRGAVDACAPHNTAGGRKFRPPQVYVTW